MEWILNCYFINHYYINNKMIMHLRSNYIDDDNMPYNDMIYALGHILAMIITNGALIYYNYIDKRPTNEP